MAIPRLPDAELEIMKIIWQIGGTAASAEITKQLEGKKNWAVTTVLNFLARLADRGFLSVSKSGKTNIYTALIDEDTYLEAESKNFLEKLHGNSFKSLVASLYGGQAISQQDLAELRQFLEQKAEENV